MCTLTFLVSICTAVSYSMFGIAAIFDCFSFYLATDFDCTPVETMATLLLQSLQRIPDVAESRSRHLIPLFLKFMGYEYDDGSIFRYLVDKLSYFCSLYLNLEVQSLLMQFLNFKLLQC